MAAEDNGGYAPPYKVVVGTLPPVSEIATYEPVLLDSLFYKAQVTKHNTDVREAMTTKTMGDLVLTAVGPSPRLHFDSGYPRVATLGQFLSTVRQNGTEIKPPKAPPASFRTADKDKKNEPPRHEWHRLRTTTYTKPDGTVDQITNPTPLVYLFVPAGTDDASPAVKLLFPVYVMLWRMYSELLQKPLAIEDKQHTVCRRLANYMTGLLRIFRRGFGMELGHPNILTADEGQEINMYGLYNLTVRYPELGVVYDSGYVRENQEDTAPRPGLYVAIKAGVGKERPTVNDVSADPSPTLLRLDYAGLDAVSNLENPCPPFRVDEFSVGKRTFRRDVDTEDMVYPLAIRTRRLTLKVKADNAPAERGADDGGEEPISKEGFNLQLTFSLEVAVHLSKQQRDEIMKCESDRVAQRHALMSGLVDPPSPTTFAEATRARALDLPNPPPKRQALVVQSPAPAASGPFSTTVPRDPADVNSPCFTVSPDGNLGDWPA
jgi:hypothetical protein